MKHIYIGAGITIIGVAVLSFIGIYANSLRTTIYNPYASYSPFPSAEPSPTEFPTSSPTMEPSPTPAPSASPSFCGIPLAAQVAILQNQIEDLFRTYNTLKLQIDQIHYNQIIPFSTKIRKLQEDIYRCTSGIDDCTSDEIAQAKESYADAQKQYDAMLAPFKTLEAQLDKVLDDLSFLRINLEKVLREIELCSNQA